LEAKISKPDVYKLGLIPRCLVLVIAKEVKHGSILETKIIKPFAYKLGLIPFCPVLVIAYPLMQIQ